MKVQDLVLLHHELDVSYEDGRPTEHHTATLLALGETANDCVNSQRSPQSAMAKTVGLTAAIGAQVCCCLNLIRHLWEFMAP
jgi:hypothetical protein